MLRSKISVILFVLASLLLSGCKVDSVYDVYSADLLEVTESNSVISSPGQVRIEVSGCEENIGKVMDIAKNYYEVASEAVCASKGMDNFVEFSTDVPLVPFGQRLPGNSPTGLAVRKNSETEFELFAVIEKGRFAGMEAEVKKMDSTASLEINLVTVIFNNDLREPIQIETPSAWINNEPQTFGSITLDRRQKAEIILSNVFSSTLRSNNQASIGKMTIK